MLMDGGKAAGLDGCKPLISVVIFAKDSMQPERRFLSRVRIKSCGTKGTQGSVRFMPYFIHPGCRDKGFIRCLPENLKILCTDS